MRKTISRVICMNGVKIIVTHKFAVSKTIVERKETLMYFEKFLLPFFLCCNILACNGFHEDPSVWKLSFSILIKLYHIFHHSHNFFSSLMRSMWLSVEFLPVPDGKFAHISSRRCAKVDCNAQSKPNTIMKAVMRYVFYPLITISQLNFHL